MTAERHRGRGHHSEVLVKVNAWVDSGVAPLVVALSSRPELVTVDSCQESSDPAAAYVAFVTRGTSVAKAAARLARELARAAPDAHYLVRLEWVAGGRRPIGSLVVMPDSVAAVAAAIRGLPTHRRTL